MDQTNYYMITVTRSHADISGIGVDVQRAAHKPLVADHVAAI